MQNSLPPHESSAEARQRRHESADPSLRGVMIAVALVVAGTIACCVVVWFMMQEYNDWRPMAVTMAKQGTIIAPDKELLTRFPGPNLQTDPHEDLEALKLQDRAVLTSYGWVNRTNEIVRVPIARAMELLLERGLPVRDTNRPVRVGKSRLELIQERAVER